MYILSQKNCPHKIISQTFSQKIVQKNFISRFLSEKCPKVIFVFVFCWKICPLEIIFHISSFTIVQQTSFSIFPQKDSTCFSSGNRPEKSHFHLSTGKMLSRIFSFCFFLEKLCNKKKFHFHYFPKSCPQEFFFRNYRIKMLEKAENLRKIRRA